MLNRIYFQSLLGLALLLLLPVASILWTLPSWNLETWEYLWEGRLLELSLNSIALAAGVGALTFFLGCTLAWIVCFYEFPAKRFFESFLLFPLAIPGYVMGFIFLSQLGDTGELAMWMQRQWGQNLSFPNLSNLAGLIIVLSLALYPYTYLMARSGFREQDYAWYEVAQSLGMSRTQMLWRVAIPAARPSIMLGVLLVVMECFADFGTVSVFAYDTFTTAIYQLWFGLYHKEAALQLALVLLAAALCLFWAEQKTRAKAQYYRSPRKARAIVPTKAKGRTLVGIYAYLGTVVGFGFVAPVTILILWCLNSETTVWDESYLELLKKSMTLAAAAAFSVMGIAVLMGYGQRLFKSNFLYKLTRLSSMGYALPGSVIAVGVLIPLSAMDHSLNHYIQHYFHTNIGLFFTGSAITLVCAYNVRFLTMGLNPVTQSLSRIAPALDNVAQSFGISGIRRFRLVHYPLIRQGLFTGWILVFVETMKEMPATLLLRPFGLDTLATKVWELSSESYWSDAALPALTIVVAELIPVLVLIHLSKTSSSS